MIYIGIDPGKKGAMAVIHDADDRQTVEIINREDGYTAVLISISGAVWQGEKAICCLEHVPIIPKNGSIATFNLGAEFGWCKGILEALEIPYELVNPQKWKKEYSVTADKNTSIAVAKRLFPDVDLKRTERCRKDDDNRAEALLMAEYARRNL